MLKRRSVAVAISICCSGIAAAAEIPWLVGTWNGAATGPKTGNRYEFHVAFDEQGGYDFLVKDANCRLGAEGSYTLRKVSGTSVLVTFHAPSKVLFKTSNACLDQVASDGGIPSEKFPVPITLISSGERPSATIGKVVYQKTTVADVVKAFDEMQKVMRMSDAVLSHIRQ
jgi:hypothetical protein